MSLENFMKIFLYIAELYDLCIFIYVVFYLPSFLRTSFIAIIVSLRIMWCISNKLMNNNHIRNQLTVIVGCYPVVQQSIFYY